MKKIRHILVSLAVFTWHWLGLRHRGTVIDSETREPLIGANLLLVSTRITPPPGGNGSGI